MAKSLLWIHAVIKCKASYLIGEQRQHPVTRLVSWSGLIARNQRCLTPTSNKQHTLFSRKANHDHQEKLPSSGSTFTQDNLHKSATALSFANATPRWWHAFKLHQAVNDKRRLSIYLGMVGSTRWSDILHRNIAWTRRRNFYCYN